MTKHLKYYSERAVKTFDRLTERNAIGDVFVMPDLYARQFNSQSEPSALEKALHRLAAYENTGLTPDEINELKSKGRNTMNAYKCDRCDCYHDWNTFNYTVTVDPNVIMDSVHTFNLCYNCAKSLLNWLNTKVSQDDWKNELSETERLLLEVHEREEAERERKVKPNEQAQQNQEAEKQGL